MEKTYKYRFSRRAIYWTLVYLVVFVLLGWLLYHLYEGGYLSAWFTSFIVALIALMSLSIPRRIVVTDEKVEVRCLLDITEIRRDYDFPVFARAASPGTSLGRYKTVAMNEPALIGGITVHPGDIIVGDVEGVVVVPHAQAAEVLAMAREIDQRELEQAKLIVASGSLRGGLAKYGRI